MEWGDAIQFKSVWDHTRVQALFPGYLVLEPVGFCAYLERPSCDSSGEEYMGLLAMALPTSCGEVTSAIGDCCLGASYSDHLS